MNRKKREEKRMRIDRMQRGKEDKYFRQGLKRLIANKDSYIKRIEKELALDKRRIILIFLASILLLILLSEGAILWILFCLAAAYLVIPIKEYRFWKKILATEKQELENYKRIIERAV